VHIRQRAESGESIDAGQGQAVDAVDQRERVAGRDQVEAADAHRPLPRPGLVVWLGQAGEQRVRLGDQRPGAVPRRIGAQHPEAQRPRCVGLGEQRLGLREAGARRRDMRPKPLLRVEQRALGPLEDHRLRPVPKDSS
jgi:hypothetical protein